MRGVSFSRASAAESRIVFMVLTRLLLLDVMAPELSDRFTAAFSRSLSSTDVVGGSSTKRYLRSSEFCMCAF